jgi:alkylation response protein AidB-like acyl-CoA dehydrogenase
MNEEDSIILDAVDQFLDRDVRPDVRALEAADEYPQEIADKMAELGLFGATISEDYGGLGLSAATYSKIVERVAAVWMSVSGIFNSHLIMCAAIERFATEEMKSTYLPKCASGELRGSVALTESGCGTDLQAIRTRAKFEGNGYILNGSKMWCTNIIKGNIVAVLAKTDQVGYRGVDTGEIQLDDIHVPAANLIGPNEGKGLNQILAGLELGRINVAARGVGVARACLDESVAYAQTRETFGKPISEHQSIQIKLADMATKVEAARLLTEQAAAAYDRGERCDMEAGMAKLAATEAALENATEAMRIHGAYGYSTEYNIERYYRDAPFLCIGEGTNEIQRLIIAKQLVERNPI